MEPTEWDSSAMAAELQHHREQLEKVMLTLDPTRSTEEHEQYLAGFIDCLQETNVITEEIRNILYAEYAC